MKGKIYIDEDLIGETIFKMADESMGGIIGFFIPTSNYEKYKKKIQFLTKEKGIANISDFNFSITIENEEELNPRGGIGITDIKGYEIIIESAGNEQSIIEKIKK